MSKTEHNQYKINNQTYACYKCGLVMCEDTFSLPCPPWERQSEGGIPQSGSQLEAGVLNTLNHLRARAEELWKEVQNLDPHETTIIGNAAIILDGIDELILKLEGQTKK